MQNILVLCIGNICRSPMAEGLLRNALPGKDIRSAGLHAMIGKPADPFSVRIMAEQGIDISGHRAQLISEKLVSEADLILTMDLDQKKYVESHYLPSKGKVFRLGEAAGVDIGDPYRQGMESFRESYQLIDEGVTAFAARIRQIG